MTNMLKHTMNMVDMVMGNSIEVDTFYHTAGEPEPEPRDLNNEDVQSIIEDIAYGDLDELTLLANLDKWDELGVILIDKMKEGKEEVE